MKSAHARESAAVDALDAKIAHCLQAAPRASFAVIGTVLGVSEQTVARRYRRLRAAAAVRVIGFVDPTPFGRQNWMLRLFCRPDSATSVGRALAAREDTQWVALMGGGTEVDCVLRPRSLDDQEELLLRQLPHTVPITGIEAANVLHIFRGSTTRDWRIGEDFLTEDDEARLNEGTVVVRTGRTVELTPSDESMLRVLMTDGRATYAELRGAVGGDWTDARIRRRVNELREAGVLYFDVDIDENAFGVPLSARVVLTVAPAHLHAAGEALGSHRAVRFCGATTGATSLTATVAFANSEELYRFVSEDVGRLEGVSQVQVWQVTRIIKRAGALIERDRSGK